jgi:hypothetical protein
MRDEEEEERGEPFGKKVLPRTPLQKLLYPVQWTASAGSESRPLIKIQYFLCEARGKLIYEAKRTRGPVDNPLTIHPKQLANAWKHCCMTTCCSAEQSANILRSWACLSTRKPKSAQDAGQAFRPALVAISGKADRKKLSQNRRIEGFLCRGASRSALISGGSRTTPTEVTVNSSPSRQILPASLYWHYRTGRLESLPHKISLAACYSGLPKSVSIRPHRNHRPYRNHIFLAHHYGRIAGREIRPIELRQVDGSRIHRSDISGPVDPSQRKAGIAAERSCGIASLAGIDPHIHRASAGLITASQISVRALRVRLSQTKHNQANCDN